MQNIKLLNYLSFNMQSATYVMEERHFMMPDKQRREKPAPKHTLT